MHVIGLCPSGSLNVTWKRTATTLFTITPLRRIRGYPEMRRERPPIPRLSVLSVCEPPTIRRAALRHEGRPRTAATRRRMRDLNHWSYLSVRKNRRLRKERKAETGQ